MHPPDEYFVVYPTELDMDSTVWICYVSSILQNLYDIIYYYYKTSSISRNKSQSLDISRLVLQLSLLNPLKPDVTM